MCARSAACASPAGWRLDAEIRAESALLRRLSPRQAAWGPLPPTPHSPAAAGVGSVIGTVTMADERTAYLAALLCDHACAGRVEKAETRPNASAGRAAPRESQTSAPRLIHCSETIFPLFFLPCCISFPRPPRKMSHQPLPSSRPPLSQQSAKGHRRGRASVRPGLLPRPPRLRRRRRWPRPLPSA